MNDDEIINLDIEDNDEVVNLAVSVTGEHVDIEANDVVEVSKNQNKTITPTESQQEITADAGYTGLGTVTVEAIPDNYGLITWDGSIITVS